MPTVAFGAGIYAALLVLQTQASVQLKAGIALSLTLVGLAAQLWVYARENPRTQSTEVSDQLARITGLVELIVRSSHWTSRRPHEKLDAGSWTQNE